MTLQEQLKSIVKCIDSLNTALKGAHGSSQTTTSLDNMTALDLIVLIGPNNIDFKYNNPTQRENTCYETATRKPCPIITRQFDT